MRLRRNFAAIALGMSLVSLATVSPSQAADPDLSPRSGSWFTQFGPVIINFRGKSEVSVNGTPAPGVQATPNDDLTVSYSIGYNFTPNISTQLVLGVTPDTSVTNGAGVLLGRMTYGAPSVVFDYRLTNLGAFQPFAGIGATYIWVRDETDGALSNLKVDSAFGLILRAGAEVMMTKNVGLYFAANRFFVDTEASGYLGAARVDAKLDLDPWLFRGGMTYRF